MVIINYELYMVIINYMKYRNQLISTHINYAYNNLIIKLSINRKWQFWIWIIWICNENVIILLKWWKNMWTTAKSAMGLVGEGTVDVRTEVERCFNFSVGDRRKQEFYSPGFPAEYPSRVDCILILKGHRRFSH